MGVGVVVVVVVVVVGVVVGMQSGTGSQRIFPAATQKLKENRKYFRTKYLKTCFYDCVCVVLLSSKILASNSSCSRLQH